ncbi:MAG TPA: DUF504 domain-containing protein [Geobacteraceae bacterium]
MITIRELLNRIRWDREFNRGEFTIGYYDRLAEEVIRVPLSQVRFDPDDRFSFQLFDAAGEPLSIPLHRVCEVYRNDELIWHRARCRTGGKGRSAVGNDKGGRLAAF